MGMPADDQVCFGGGEDGQQRIFRSSLGENFIFIPQGRVAKQDLAQAGHRNAERLRPSRHGSRLIGRNFPSHPAQCGLILFRDSRNLSREAVKNRDFSVAQNEFDRTLELCQTGKSLAWHRPRQNVATNDNAVHLQVGNFPEDGLQRR